MTNKNHKRSSTSTSSFGSPGRVSHDASTFYNSKLYESQPKDRQAPYLENPISAEKLDRIFCSSSE
ncbi:MAG: hypothetical protein KAI94_04950, partial [Anaerolineales bacterium]|nr:hypothetical protein [Anaerolineales bacterium]